MNQSETTSAAGGGEKPPHVESFAINPEGGPDIYVEGHNRFVNEDDFLEYKAWAERKIAALAAPTAKGGTEVPKIVRHIKTGGLYEVLCGFAQVQTGAPLNDYASVAVYRGLTPPRLTWVRPLIEFNDERFEFGPELTAEESAALASPPPPAGAAGGGSGDLAALSAGATPGEWHYRCSIPGRAWIADAPEGQSHSKIILGKQALYGGDADYAFVAALVSAYRSGRLIEAPTPDLGALSARVREYLSAVEPVTGFVTVAMPVDEARAIAALSAPTPDLGAQGEPVAWAQMLAALKSVNKLIAEAGMTGFNCHDGDWAERLFFSQQATSAAIKAASAAPGLPPCGGPGLKLVHRRSRDDGRPSGRY